MTDFDDDDDFDPKEMFRTDAFEALSRLPEAFRQCLDNADGPGILDNATVLALREELGTRDPAFFRTGAAERMLLPHVTLLAEALGRVTGAPELVTRRSALAYADACPQELKAFLRAESVRRWAIEKISLVVNPVILGDVHKERAWMLWRCDAFVARFPFRSIFVSDQCPPQKSEGESEGENENRPAPGGWLVELDWFRGDWFLSVTYMAPGETR